MLLLPLGLSAISLVHSMEMDKNVHEHHTCEVYEAICHALSSYSSMSVPSDEAQCYQIFDIQFTAHVSSELPRTRSPPHFV
ncbi:MAG: DUF2607 family protein [Vibrionaceae bacterium]|nr:DUF2607 family protein [Vibrionaceae bacterium]